MTTLSETAVLLPPPPPPSKRRRWPWAVGAGLVLATAAGAATVGLGGGGIERPMLNGTFTLMDDFTDPSIAGDWDSCFGTGGYSDFGAGMNVTIRDGEGKIVASSETRNVTKSDGESPIPQMAEDTSAVIGEDYDWLCQVAIVPVALPRADFYEVEIGSRGALSFTAQELADEDYYVNLTLGDALD